MTGVKIASQLSRVEHPQEQAELQRQKDAPSNPTLFQVGTSPIPSTNPQKGPCVRHLGRWHCAETLAPCDAAQKVSNYTLKDQIRRGKGVIVSSANPRAQEESYVLSPGLVTNQMGLFDVRRPSYCI